MNFIQLTNVTINIPLYPSEAFSLRRRIFNKSGNVQIKKVLDNICLEINEGDKVGLYGPNGSGKTSLLRAIVGAYTPSEGAILTSGSIRSLIDIQMGLDGEASGFDNIKLKLISMGINYRQYPIINEIVQFSGLGDAIKYPIKTYSSGMSVRLAFSIATCIGADILLLDEWLSVGDAEFSNRSSRRMDEISSKSSIMILASHNLDLINSQCNRIVHMEHGKIIKDTRIDN